MPTTLARADVIGALRDIVQRLKAVGDPATIQLVGGAAISLTIDGDRPPTKDVDATITPANRVRAVADDVGVERGWPDGWLDENAAIFLPSQFGRGAEWVTIHDQNGVIVQVGSPEMLLAMKLVAAEKRFLRDADDVALLLSATGIQSADQAEALLESFYPGDGLSVKVYGFVERVLADGLPSTIPPELPELS